MHKKGFFRFSSWVLSLLYSGVISVSLEPKPEAQQRKFQPAVYCQLCKHPDHHTRLARCVQPSPWVSLLCPVYRAQLG